MPDRGRVKTPRPLVPAGGVAAPANSAPRGGRSLAKARDSKGRDSDEEAWPPTLTKSNWMDSSASALEAARASSQSGCAPQVSTSTAAEGCKELAQQFCRRRPRRAQSMARATRSEGARQLAPSSGGSRCNCARKASRSLDNGQASTAEALILTSPKLTSGTSVAKATCRTKSLASSKALALGTGWGSMHVQTAAELSTQTTRSNGNCRKGPKLTCTSASVCVPACAGPGGSCSTTSSAETLGGRCCRRRCLGS
mmetsp:Transcript_91225/g.263223  ORF Transcript_91225/g.263223 Transcript_91225/m.263223 type:complete len:254 (-) Transcript_91225:439-1200(-)